MYHEYIIHNLSDPVLRKLMKGDKVRMRKHHIGHRVFITKEQAKLLEDAHKKKKSVMIGFTDGQIKHHIKVGSGLFDSLKSFVKKHKDVFNPIIRTTKNAGHILLNKASNNLHSKINALPEIEGEGVVSDILGAISKGANLFGLGAKPRRTRGKGFMGDLMKGATKAIVPALVDAGSNMIKDKINGLGIKKRGRPRKTTTTRKVGRPRKIKAGALFPAGYN